MTGKLYFLGLNYHRQYIYWDFVLVCHPTMENFWTTESLHSQKCKVFWHFFWTISQYSYYCDRPSLCLWRFKMYKHLYHLYGKTRGTNHLICRPYVVLALHLHTAPYCSGEWALRLLKWTKCAADFRLFILESFSKWSIEENIGILNVVE